MNIKKIKGKLLVIFGYIPIFAIAALLDIIVNLFIILWNHIFIKKKFKKYIYFVDIACKINDFLYDKFE